MSSLASLLDGGPWQVDDVPKAGTRLFVGFLGIGAGWVGTSGTAVFTQQLAWAAVGVAGAALGAMGAVLWLLAGFRRVGAERVALRGALAPFALAAVPLPVAVAGPLDAALVTGPGMTRVHRAGCHLVAGKQVWPVSPADLDRGGLAACGVCAP